MERFTKYECRLPVLKDETRFREAIRKLAELEDLEEMVMKRAVELYVSTGTELKAPGERVEALGLSNRAINLLKQNNIKYLDELCELTEYDLMKMRHFGEKALLEIKTKLEAYGRKLGE